MGTTEADGAPPGACGGPESSSGDRGDGGGRGGGNGGGRGTARGLRVVPFRREQQWRSECGGAGSGAPKKERRRDRLWAAGRGAAARANYKTTYIGFLNFSAVAPARGRAKLVAVRKATSDK